ncbi:MAG: hypothetical protein FWC11_03305 [Firmicutes bacterium]|nr:hypothetical protein [Bacillota bacterium]MCL2255868.1 hypothetical protein [Bacillota bacterium]
MSKNIITTSSQSPKNENNNDNEGKGILGRLKKMRHKEFLIAGIAVLIMLVLYFTTCSSSFGSDANTSNNNNSNVSDSECRLLRIERQLEDAVRSVNGISNAQVIINWESTMEIIIAYMTQSGQNTSTQNPILTQGGRPVIIREIYPSIIGVLIVADGAQDPRVRVELINAVVTLLNIRPAQVAVLAM